MSEVKKRKVHTPEFKAKVGLEALRGARTTNQISQEPRDTTGNEEHDLLKALDKLLFNLSNEAPIIFIPNPGNAGDSLINCANFQILKKLGIKFETIPYDCDPLTTKGRIVIYGAAGGLVPHYSVSLKFIERHHKNAKKLIILPRTIRGCETLLAELGENVTIMCRDKDTQHHVTATVRTAVTVLDIEDSALSTDINKVLKEGPSLLAHLKHELRHSFYNFRIAAYHTIRWARLYSTHYLKLILKKSERSLFVFRNDSEKTIHPPPGNLDISAYLECNDMTEIGVNITSYRMLKFLSLYDIIHTNRLHAAIAALLLGKKVHLYDNSYGKNSAIYERSLKVRFKNNITLRNDTTNCSGVANGMSSKSLLMLGLASVIVSQLSDF